MTIKDVDTLRGLYGVPSDRAIKKMQIQLDKHAVNFINKSPFLLISTVDSEGKMDVSPRGGTAGFIKIINNHTLLIPDAKGNNRLDSLENIIETGQFGSLFLIPGIDETLRLNGTAVITTDKEHLDHYSNERIAIKSCIKVTVQETFMHCAKAFMRSKLWDHETQIERSSFPTMGQILKDQIGGDEIPEKHAAMVERYKKDI